MSRLLGFLHDQVKKDGNEVDFFTSEHIPLCLNSRLGRFAFPWLLWRYAVAAAKAGRPYDVVNVHEPSSAAVTLGKSAAGNPFIVVTSHGVEDRGWAIALEDGRLGRARLRLQTRLWYPLTVLAQARIGLRRADHIFCLNEEDRVFLQEKYRLPTDRITRLFPGAAPAYAAVFPQRDYRLADRLLVFGTWLPRKGLADIVAAFVTLASLRSDLKLLMMGLGFQPEVVLESFPVCLRGRVEFVPSATEAEFAAQMLKAAVYLIPSLFEGTPLTLMEAMATGLPVVGTATCGMKDVIRDGVNGLLVPIRNPVALAAAINQLLSDAQLREQLGRQAHADVMANYTWDRVAHPIRIVYQEFARQRAGLPRGLSCLR
jgi:glycosyltransferase involved in cell wall biosynthesis